MIKLQILTSSSDHFLDSAAHYSVVDFITRMLKSPRPTSSYHVLVQSTQVIFEAAARASRASPAGLTYVFRKCQAGPECIAMQDIISMFESSSASKNLNSTRIEDEIRYDKYSMMTERSEETPRWLQSLEPRCIILATSILFASPEAGRLSLNLFTAHQSQDWLRSLTIDPGPPYTNYQNARSHEPHTSSYETWFTGRQRLNVRESFTVPDADHVSKIG